ncbi:MAG: Rrf2 family transcriptional regulator [Bacteroidales bacterium]|nr:Rrf2 family transcriptional regulator [Bacteroidales bacterium]
MLTQKTRYAMLAITKLAKEYGNGAVLISDIATSEKIPKRFLETILLELKKKGYLGSRLGKKGGYFLIKNPKEITLLEIIDLFEGTIAWLACTCDKCYRPCEHCKEEQTCKIRHTFKDIREYTHKKLSKTSIFSLIEVNKG